MELEAIIGLEIHVQLKTSSKMFCSCANIETGTPGDDGEPIEPNTAICPVCLGYPGTLPVPNKKAIAWTQRAGAALGCRLAEVSKFDRKHYFYPDLPKGYQISQFDQPFCGEGSLEVVVDDERRTIGIERIHLEEDAAKNTHPKGAKHTLVDYNRAGTPLMEIVTKPDLRSPAEARVFLQELQRIMRTIGVSDADMEKGQMRCDANISLRTVGETTLHPKTEIKNVNSFKFVEKALAYEIDRQRKEWEQGGPPQEQATRGFDAEKGVTTAQRQKEAAADYRYFPEPDIPPFSFSPKELTEVRAAVPELPLAKQARFMRQLGVSAQAAHDLAQHADLASFAENVASEIEQLEHEEVKLTPAQVKPLVQLAAKLILRQMRDLLADGVSADELKISAANFAELVVMVKEGRINQDAVAPMLAEMQKTGGDPDHVVQNLGLEQVQDEDALGQFVDDVIAEHPDVVEKIKAGKDAALQFLMGQVMAKSRGTASPPEVISLLKKKISGS